MDDVEKNLEQAGKVGKEKSTIKPAANTKIEQLRGIRGKEIVGLLRNTAYNDKKVDGPKYFFTERHGSIMSKIIKKSR